jgi:hypothetical protein
MTSLFSPDDALIERIISKRNILIILSIYNVLTHTIKSSLETIIRTNQNQVKQEYALCLVL